MSLCDIQVPDEAKPDFEETRAGSVMPVSSACHQQMGTSSFIPWHMMRIKMTSSDPSLACVV